MTSEWSGSDSHTSSSPTDCQSMPMSLDVSELRHRFGNQFFVTIKSTWPVDKYPDTVLTYTEPLISGVISGVVSGPNTYSLASGSRYRLVH